MYIIEGNGAMISWVLSLINLFCSIRGRGKLGEISLLEGPVFEIQQHVSVTKPHPNNATVFWPYIFSTSALMSRSD